MQFYGSKEHYFRYFEQHPKTLREQHYLGCLAAVLNKPRWWEKFEDDTIRAKWAAELPLEEADIDFLFHELRYLRDHKLKLDPTGNVLSPLPAIGTHISDTVVDEGLIEELARQLSAAEQEALESQRWHPGSENITLDIFHPSNYCMTYGKTRISEKPHVLFGDKVFKFPDEVYDVFSEPPSDHDRYVPAAANGLSDVSKAFQWLPSEFEVAEDGKITIRSYINNLHPRRHKGAYHAIAKVFGKMIPMFEMALGTLERRSPHRITYDEHSDPSARAVRDKFCEQLDSLETLEERIDFVKSIPIEGAEDVDWDDVDFDSQQLEMFLFDHGYDGDGPLVPLTIPGFPAFETYMEEMKEHLQDRVMPLLGRKLQVIVKAASINLTPENPRYPGGGWHLEGTENECIAATGILYYSVSNIKDARVEFREVFDSFAVEGFESKYRLGKVYGVFSHKTINVQACGHAEASKTGRVLVFPNSNQHRVPPFELEDPTKPGHRKMLVFFLVHPDTRVPSALNVPPQQWEWGIEELGRVLPKRMPTDCLPMVLSHLGLRSDVEDKKLAKKVVVGSGGVGKSCLTVRFLKDEFSNDYDPTIEENYRKSITVDGQACVVNLIDTAGQHEYTMLRDQHLAAGGGFLLVFALNDRATFEEVKQLREKIIKLKDTKRVPIVLCGNKCDLPLDQIEVNEDIVRDYATPLKIPYFNTSAKDSINVTESFHELVREGRRIGRSSKESGSKSLANSRDNLRKDSKAPSREVLSGESKSGGCCIVM
ncbi:hypothetical protein HDU96_007578 [Phlyctochytrium bullatum]|nr:hypothetical protein HDU96_007578 [Phlyctochytrium bullatum]